MPSDLTPDLFIGLDAGGTKTKLLARGAGADVELIGPAANLNALGVQRVAAVLTELVQKALAERPGAHVAGVCAGVAGAGREHERARLHEALRQSLAGLAPDARFVTVHDAAIALEAAFEGESGMIIIVGTGSIVYARDDAGAFHRAGGWGYLLGDEGGGYAIGLAGIKAVSVELDGGPQTRLRERLAETFELHTAEDIIRAVYRQTLRLPHVAPLIIDLAQNGDLECKRILREQSRMLARQVHWLARRCGPMETQVSLLGGLAGNAFYRRMLMDAILERQNDWRFSAPRHEPVFGALRLAMKTADEPAA